MKKNDDISSIERDWIKRYFTRWIKQIEKQLNERWRTQIANLAIALQQMEKRLDALNELRQIVQDANRLMVLKTEYTQAMCNLEKAINTLELAQSKTMTKDEHITYQHVMESALTELKLAVSKSFTKDEHLLYAETVSTKLRPLEDYDLLLKSKASQTTVNMSIGIGVISLLIGVISIVLAVIKLVAKTP